MSDQLPVRQIKQYIFGTACLIEQHRASKFINCTRSAYKHICRSARPSISPHRTVGFGARGKDVKWRP